MSESIRVDYIYLKSFDFAVLRDDYAGSYSLFAEHCCRITHSQLDHYLIKTPYLVEINSDTIVALSDLCQECEVMQVASPISTLISYRESDQDLFAKRRHNSVQDLAKEFSYRQVITLNGRKQYLRCFDGYVNIHFPKLGMFPYFYKLLNKPSLIAVNLGHHWHEFSQDILLESRTLLATKSNIALQQQQLNVILIFNLFFLKVGIDSVEQILNIQQLLLIWLNEAKDMKWLYITDETAYHERLAQYLELCHMSKRHQNSHYFDESVMPELKQGLLSLATLKIKVLSQIDIDDENKDNI